MSNMFSRLVGGPKFNFNFNDTDYEVIDPTEFITDLFTYPVYPDDHWEMVVIIQIGSPGSGKSTTVKYFGLKCRQVYGDQLHAFQTNDLTYALKGMNQDTSKRSFVEFISLDDAITSGYDSRRSMSGANVDISQNYFKGRHLLANENKYGTPDERVKAGLAFIVISVQSPKRLDKSLRENAHLIIWKSYYDELDSVLDEENLQFIKDVTYESMIKHNYEARSSGIGITRDGRVVKITTPKVDFDIPVLIPPVNRYDNILNVIIDTIVDYTKKNEGRKPSDPYMKGFLITYLEENEIESPPNLELLRIINKAKYLSALKLNGKDDWKNDGGDESTYPEDCTDCPNNPATKNKINEYDEWFTNKILGESSAVIAERKGFTPPGITARIRVQEKKIKEINPKMKAFY